MNGWLLLSFCCILCLYGNSNYFGGLWVVWFFTGNSASLKLEISLNSNWFLQKLIVLDILYYSHRPFARFWNDTLLLKNLFLWTKWMEFYFLNPTDDVIKKNGNGARHFGKKELDFWGEPKRNDQTCIHLFLLWNTKEDTLKKKVVWIWPYWHSLYSEKHSNSSIYIYLCVCSTEERKS